MNKATVNRFVLLALLWGSSFTFISTSLEGLTPAQLALSRLALGAVVLVAVARWRRVVVPTDPLVRLHVVAAGVLGNVLPFLLLSYAEQSIGAGLAGVLVGCTPLLTLGLASALRTDRVTRRTVVGMFVGFVGVVIVIGPWDGAGGSLTGQLAALGAALSYAAGFVYVRRFLSQRGLDPLGLAASQLTAAVVVQAALLPLFAWRTPQLTPAVLASIVPLGVLGTGVAYVWYFRLIADVGATTASAVNYLVPAFAVLLGVLVLDEPLTWHLVVGGLVVAAGVVHADGRFGRARTTPFQPLLSRPRITTSPQECS